jgi:hypothetical protein
MVFKLAKRFAIFYKRKAFSARFFLFNKLNRQHNLIPMQSIEFFGLFQNALSGSVFISIAGPNHFHHSETQTGKLDLTQNLAPGSYKIGFSVFTDGTFTVNIKGTITSVSPQLPYTLPSNYDEIDLVV